MAFIKKDIKSLTLQQLQEELAAGGFPKFRADQLYRWLHVQLAEDYDEMSNLPKAMKTYLQEHYTLTRLTVLEHKVSKIDGTQKFLFALPDGETVESVFMQYKFGNSVCVSSQVGCRMGCRFCASTLDGLKRNLLPGEILEQIYSIRRIILRERENPSLETAKKMPASAALRDRTDALHKKPAGNNRMEIAEHETRDPLRISHVVVMGTGEPLDNYDNLVQFLRMLTDENGLHLSQRNVTVSTCGIVPCIYDLADEHFEINLALSLHASTDEKRKEIMPVANRYSIQELMAACRYYFQQTGRRVTFEYSLIRDVNDSDEDAERLAKLAGSIDTAAHINLIPVNPVKERNYVQPDLSAVRAFQHKLEKHGINVSIRRVLGRDIDGACGQLRHRKILEGD